MKSMFTSGSYQTSGKAKLPLSHYLLFGSRWGMHIRFIRDVIFAFRREALDGKYDDARWVRSSERTLEIMEEFGGRFDIQGIDNIPMDGGPYVFVGNHMSTLETAVLPCIIRPRVPVTYVVKKQLTEGNIFGPIMRSRDPIAVARKNPREDLHAVLEGGQERLKNGISIIIFPQSTRTPVLDPEKFNSLGIKLALRAGVQVIPFAVKTDFWGDGKIIRGFGPVHRDRKIHIEFGKPISPQGRGKKEHQQVLDFIRDRLAAWEISDSAE